MSPRAAEERQGWTDVHDGARLFTRSWVPQATRAALLLVHGLGDHSGRYDGLARALAREGVAVTGFDLRGHGRSPGTRGDAPSLEALLDDVAAVGRSSRHTVGEDRPWFLFGHSMGGLLALLYAVRARPDPLRGLLASAPWLATRGEVPAWKEVLGRLLVKVAPAVTLSTGIRGEEMSRDPEWVRAYREDPLVHDRISARLYDLVGRAQEEVRGAKLKIPALFLVPEADPLVDSQVTRRFAEGEGADLRLFPDFRHEGFGEVGRERFIGTAVEWILAHMDETPD